MGGMDTDGIYAHGGWNDIVFVGGLGVLDYSIFVVCIDCGIL